VNFIPARGLRARRANVTVPHLGIERIPAYSPEARGRSERVCRSRAIRQHQRPQHHDELRDSPRRLSDRLHIRGRL